MVNNTALLTRFDEDVKSSNQFLSTNPVPPLSLRVEEYIKKLFQNYPPDSSVSVFQLINNRWLNDVSIQEKMIEIVRKLDTCHFLLFNAVLWDYERLERFCTGPSSLNGHHFEKNGNIRHTLEVAEEMLRLCQGRSSINASLAVLLTLLHDIGKADEYLQTASGGWKMSERGVLIGHKVTALEWVIQAINRWNIAIPQDHYVAILHVLSSVPYAPDWMGLRQPMMFECELLSIADRLSGKDDLMLQTNHPNGGFGRYHKHLGYAPFSVRT